MWSCPELQDGKLQMSPSPKLETIFLVNFGGLPKPKDGSPINISKSVYKRNQKGNMVPISMASWICSCVRPFSNSAAKLWVAETPAQCPRLTSKWSEPRSALELCYYYVTVTMYICANDMTCIYTDIHICTMYVIIICTFQIEHVWTILYGKETQGYLELALDVCHVATGSGVFSTELSDQKLLLLLCWSALSSNVTPILSSSWSLGSSVVI